MGQLIFSTGNDSKYQIAQEVCKKHRIGLTQNTLEIDEIQGEDPEKVVKDKVNKAYNLLKEPVIVRDDTFVLPLMRFYLTYIH